MRRAFAVHSAGHWPQARCLGTITLAFEDRHRRRILMTDDGGQGFLLDLPQATLLADGDGLELDDGGFLRVAAAIEDVIEIHCPDAETLARIAWHVGNRHMPVQILSSGLRMPWDHVIADMLNGLGAVAERRTAAFHPEGGAYAAGGGHGHSHGYKRG